MMLEKVVPLMLILLLGILLRRLKILKKQDGSVLSTLLVYIAVPAAVINTFSGAVIEQKLLLLPLAGGLVVVILLAISFLLVKIFRLPKSTQSSFLISFPTLEVGSVGYAFVLAVYGTNGLTQLVLFDLGNALCFFLLICPLAVSLGSLATTSGLFTGIKQMIRQPLPWAFLLGIGFNILHIHNALFSQALSTLSQGTLLFIMLLVGLECDFTFKSFRLPLLTIYLKTGLGIVVAVAIIELFNLTGVSAIVVAIGASLPSSLLTLVYAKENKLDAQYIANTLSFAMPFSVLFTTFLVSVFS